MKEKRITWAPFIVVAWLAGALREWQWWGEERRWWHCASHCKYICIYVLVKEIEKKKKTYNSISSPCHCCRRHHLCGHCLLGDLPLVISRYA